MSYARSPRAVCSTTIGTRFRAVTLTLVSLGTKQGVPTPSFARIRCVQSSRRISGRGSKGSVPRGADPENGSSRHGAFRPRPFSSARHELLERSRLVRDLRALEKRLHDLILEHARLDLRHQLAARAVQACSFFGILVRCDQLVDATLRSGPVEFDPVGANEFLN